MWDTGFQAFKLVVLNVLKAGPLAPLDNLDNFTALLREEPGNAGMLLWVLSKVESLP